MLALLLALALQDPERLIRDLDHDDLDVRTRAVEQLVKLGPSVKPALQKAAAAAGPEAKLRIEDVLKAIQRGERVAELRKHCEALDRALWIEAPGFAPAAEPDVGAEVSTPVFDFVNPALIMVYWEGEFEHFTTEFVLPHVFDRPVAGGVSPKTFIRDRVIGPKSSYSWSTGLEPGSYKDARKGTLDEIIRLWPQWDRAAPNLGLQRAIFVAADQVATRERLVAAATSDRRALRLAALHALRWCFHEHSVEAALAAMKHDDERTRTVAADTLRVLVGSIETWDKEKAGEILTRHFDVLTRRLSESWAARRGFFALPMDDWKDPTARSRTLKLLEHPDPRARRDAVQVCQLNLWKEAVPLLRPMLDTKEIPLKRAVLGALAALDPEGAPEILRPFVDDGSDDVRRLAVWLLPASEWKLAATRLEDSSIDVRRTAILKIYQAGQAEALRPRLVAQKEETNLGMVAIALVLLDADRQAARVLVDTVLESTASLRFDALYALNRMTDAATFDRLAKAKYPEMDPNAGWDDAVKALEATTGVKVEVRKEQETSRTVQRLWGSEWRLTPALLPRFLELLEDLSDEPALTFLIEDGRLVVLPAGDAIERWKAWRAKQ